MNVHLHKTKVVDEAHKKARLDDQSRYNYYKLNVFQKKSVQCFEKGCSYVGSYYGIASHYKRLHVEANEVESKCELCPVSQ